MRVNLYLDRATPLHRLHPQVKLGLLATAFVTAFLMETPVAILPIAVAEAAMIVVSGATGNVRRLGPLFLVVPIATFLIWSFFYGAGVPLPVFGRLGVTGAAVEYAAGMALKLESFLAASILFLSITPVEEFTAALRGLGLPYRVSFTIGLAFRLVPVFLSSALTVVAAQRARGLDFEKGGVVARLTRYVPVIVPVFMGALRRADQMAVALEARGFGAGRPRTSFPRRGFAPGDTAAAAVLLAAVVAYVWAWQLGAGKVVP